MKSLSSVLLLIFISVTTFAQTWVQRANIPVSTSRTTGMSTDSKGYIVFGDIGQGNNTNTLYEYNPISDSWTQKASFPGPGRGNGFSFSIGNNIYAGGGYDGFSTYFDFAEYLPDSNMWVAKTTFPGSGTRGSKGANLLGKGYVVGGTFNRSFPYSNQLWEYDPSTDMWTQKANVPFGANSGSVLFSSDSLLYITHGHNGSSMHSGMWAYNPQTDTWSQKASFPGQARLNGNALEVDGKIIVGGGHQLGIGTVKNDYYEYTPQTDSWTLMPTFSEGRRSTGAYFVIGKIGYIVGGFDSTRTNISSSWSFKPLITSLDEVNDKSPSWSVFPNPANTELTVTLESAQNGEYTIYSILGEEILRSTFSGSKTVVDCSAISEGAYFIKIISEGKAATKKLIINR